MPSESFGKLPEQSTFLRLHHTLTRVENIIALIPTVEIMFNITESNQVICILCIYLSRGLIFTLKTYNCLSRFGVKHLSLSRNFTLQRPKSNPKETFQNFDWMVILPKGQAGE
ncbi:hypothetical protein V1477_003736 [Vespula maculifrons]|uniref:Uncharacterized protein n=1 Tax=Vespula maculifrons TaxID=7453 RepID=A0ABD2CS75_VESMC